MNRTRIQIAKNDIVKYFDEDLNRFFSFRDLARILAAQRGFWRLADRTNTDEFIGFLSKQKLSEHRFKFPRREETVYVWGRAPLLEVLSHIHNKPFFSYYTATYIHGLTEQTPTAVYLNVGRSPVYLGPPRARHELPPQENIAKAFSKSPRITTNKAEVSGRDIFMLNTTEGHQGIGVELMNVQDETSRFKARVTNLERTLIDLAVRPFYSGGIGEVVKAYRNARERVSVNRLAAMLTELNYVYPYHQAIGFYLEKAGYRSSQLALLKKKPMDRDFYLDYQLVKTRYVAEWRLYVPEGF